MPSVGFEPTISVLEQAKTVHASERAATVLAASPSGRRNWVTEVHGTGWPSGNYRFESRQDKGYPDWSTSWFSATAGIVPRLGQGRFVLSPFHFIYYSTFRCYSLVTDSVMEPPPPPNTEAAVLLNRISLDSIPNFSKQIYKRKAHIITTEIKKNETRQSVNDALCCLLSKL
jgi:hypothetical protein